MTVLKTVNISISYHNMLARLTMLSKCHFKKNGLLYSHFRPCLFMSCSFHSHTQTANYKQDKKSKMSSNYVNMGDGSVKPGTNANTLNVPGIDPSLSQEEKDLRIALALQQQENAIAYGVHKKRHDAVVSSQNSRTTRSNAASRLATVRKHQKEADKNDVGSPGTYGGPDGSSDAILASELQKVEDATATTAKIIAQDSAAAKASKVRSGRSVY